MKSIIAALVLLMAATVSTITVADDAIEKTLGSTFSNSVTDAVSLKDHNLVIKLKMPSTMKDYFTTGDKANKVFAIDSCRMLRNNPDVQHITIRLPMPDGMRVLSVSRKEIEDYYGVNFSAMKDNMDLWRESFSYVYDNKESRQRFVNRFVELR